MDPGNLEDVFFIGQNLMASIHEGSGAYNVAYGMDKALEFIKSNNCLFPTGSIQTLPLKRNSVLKMAMRHCPFTLGGLLTRSAFVAMQEWLKTTLFQVMRRPRF